MAGLEQALKNLTPEQEKILNLEGVRKNQVLNDASLLETAPPPIGKASDKPPKTVIPAITNLGTVEIEQVSFLWEPYIPTGKLTLLEGDPGLGKTFLALNLCAAISRGWPLPAQDGALSQRLSPSTVLFMSAEDGLADTLAPRLEKMGADREKIYCLTGWKSSEDQEHEQSFTLADVNVLRAALDIVRPLLVVIDPLQAYLGAIDMHRANETRPLLSNLGRLAEEFSCAILAIRHLSKGGSKALYRGLGSIDFTAAARSVLLVGQEPETNKKAMVHMKSSLAENGVTQGFEISNNNGFIWTGVSQFKADDLLSSTSSTHEENNQSGQLEEAIDFLYEVLADEPLESNEVKKQAKAASISWRTIERAKQELKFNAKKSNGVWYWPQLEDLRPPQNIVGGLGGLAKNSNITGIDGTPPRPPSEICGGLGLWADIGQEIPPNREGRDDT